MSEKKDIEVFHPSENLVTTEALDVRKKLAKDSLILHGVTQGVVLTLGAIAAVTSPFIDIFQTSTILGSVGLFASTFAMLMVRKEAQGEKVYQELGLDKFSALQSHVPVGKMKNGTRLHLETFSIREASDVEITELKKNTEKVDAAHATHTIKHYMVRDNNGFRLEQECIPNHEAIWDVSADALVEVHKVNETKRRYVFNPVF